MTDTSRSEDRPVRRMPADGAPVEWVSLDEAVHKLRGYHDIGAADIRSSLLLGTRWRTAFAFYEITTEEATG